MSQTPLSQTPLSQAPPRKMPSVKGEFAKFIAVSTRWSDNDAYGHVNNAVYWMFFDAAVNQLLIEADVLDPITSPVIGLVVETTCTYFAALKYPGVVDIGIRVEALGRSSVRYCLAAFAQGQETSAATAIYTHVYVDRATQRPVPMPGDVRALLEQLTPTATQK